MSYEMRFNADDNTRKDLAQGYDTSRLRATTTYIVAG
jgi:hypothetical protein